MHEIYKQKRPEIDKRKMHEIDKQNMHKKTNERRIKLIMVVPDRKDNTSRKTELNVMMNHGRKPLRLTKMGSNFLHHSGNIFHRWLFDIYWRT